MSLVPDRRWPSAKLEGGPHQRPATLAPDLGLAAFRTQRNKFVVTSHTVYGVLLKEPE